MHTIESHTICCLANKWSLRTSIRRSDLKRVNNIQISVINYNVQYIHGLHCLLVNIYRILFASILNPLKPAMSEN